MSPACNRCKVRKENSITREWVVVVLSCRADRALDWSYFKDNAQYPRLGGPSPLVGLSSPFLFSKMSDLAASLNFTSSSVEG